MSGPTAALARVDRIQNIAAFSSIMTGFISDSQPALERQVTELDRRNGSPDSQRMGCLLFVVDFDGKF